VFDFDRNAGCPDVEDFGLRAYGAASLAGWCGKFRRNLLPPFSGVEFLVGLTLEKKEIMFPPKVENILPNYTVSQPGRTESIITPLFNPQNCLTFLVAFLNHFKKILE